jgi:hypothetical protein
MKVWNIKKPEEISQAMMPLSDVPHHPSCIHHQPDFGRKRQEEMAKVWQENPNKPTMTLE